MVIMTPRTKTPLPTVIMSVLRAKSCKKSIKLASALLIWNNFQTVSVEPLVLTVPEAAKQLRIGIGRCYELARCGRLRSIKIGKRILVPGTAIFEFMEMPEESPV